MSLYEIHRNFLLQKIWMLDLEDLHSIISNHFISTSHFQRTGIIIPFSTNCALSQLNGLW